MKQKQKIGQQSANAEIRKAETPIIDQLVSLKDVLESMSKDISNIKIESPLLPKG